jgi:hypothetical protein
MTLDDWVSLVVYVGILGGMVRIMWTKVSK